MLEKVLQILHVRCRHKNMSHPFATASTARNTRGAQWESVGTRSEHYVVCLDCGKKFQYDWNRMRIVS